MLFSTNLPKLDLLKIASQEGLKVKDKPTKQNVLDVITSEIEDAGIKQVTAQMKLVDLQEITKPLEIGPGKGNCPTKTVLRKRLIEYIEAMGLEEFLKKHTTSQTLAIFIRAVDDEPNGNAKDKLIPQAASLINLIGFTTFFSRFDTPFLQHLMTENNLKFNTDSKDKIIYALATLSNAKKDNSIQKDVVFSEKKLPIQKGITYQDIFQHYLKSEIFDWCKENGLKVSGSKKELINRILAFLGGDKENTVSVNNEKPEKRKQEPSKKDSSKKKSKFVEDEKVDQKTKNSSKSPKKNSSSKKIEEEESNED